MNIYIILTIIFAILITIFLYQLNIVKHEKFTQENNTLLIKKTNDFKQIFSNNKYSIWCPLPIDDYFPIGHYITLNKSYPKIMATLIKNELGNKSKNKPIKYDIISITNNQYAIWNPIPNDNYISLGHMYSKSYPSKFNIRCVPKKFCIKSNIESKIVNNKTGINDNGYEIWSINDSELFICNNLNNKSLNNNLNNIYTLNETKCSVEKLLYIKKTNKYKKIVSYKDSETNNEFFIWRPIPQPQFCSLGDICLSKNIDPNNKLDTIVAHNSLCKIPLNYGEKSIYNIKQSDKNINFWRPQPYNNYYFFSDIVVLGNDEPEYDNIIYSISIDYLTKLDNNTHKMIYNNLNNNKPLSIWCDTNYFLNINKSYTNTLKNGYILNELFTKSDIDLLDSKRNIIFNYTNNKNNLNSIKNSTLYNLIKKNISNKLDINNSRLINFDINKENSTIEITINSRKSNSNELTTTQILESLNNLLKNNSIKIYNNNKDIIYITLDDFHTKNYNNNIILDNSLYQSKF
jgi:hypothetical protein